MKKASQAHERKLRSDQSPMKSSLHIIRSEWAGSLAPISATLSRYKAKAKLDRSLALRSHKDTKQAC
jgi:hypothetical protein